MRLSCIVLVISVCAISSAGAQRAATDSVPITDRVYLTASASASEFHTQNQRPTLFRNWGATALMRSFVNDHWQLGVSPSVDGFYDNLNGNHVGAGTTLMAVYAVNAPFQTLAFAGGSVSQSAQSEATPRYTSTWRVGLMRFLSPTAALRVEFRSAAWSSPSLGARSEVFIIALDEFFDRHAAPMTDLPGLGIVDATVLANVIVEPDDEQSYAVTVAPFLASWLQVGGHFDYVRFAYSPSDITAQTEEGFVRLYAPFSPGLMPFIGGLVEAGTYANDVPGLSSYSGSIGVRHWIRHGLAVEGGMTLLQHRPFQPFPLGPRIRQPNELSVFASIVLPMEFRSRAR